MNGLVINLGLKSVRAILFDEHGGKHASVAHPVQTFLRDTWIEQDANEWWAKTADCVRSAIDQARGHKINFVTICASAACLVPVNAAGAPLRRAIMVSDRRSADIAEEMGGHADFQALRAVNGSFAPDPYFMAPKAGWIARNEPEVMAQTRWLFSPADFLTFRLCGVSVTDPLNAEKFYYDVNAGTYPNKFLEDFGIDPAFVPPVAPVGTRVGETTQSISAETGLPAGTPLIMSTYDAICAFWGSGVSNAGDVADVSGTVTSVRVLTDAPVAADERRVFSQPLPVPNRFAVGGSNNLGGGLVEWLKQSFYAHDQLPYSALETEAEHSGAAARGLIFLPYLLGERCPIWDPNARGVFFGLERQHQRGDFSRAVLESAAYGVNHILQTVASHGVKFRRIRVSGGLARLRLVSLIKADVTGLQVDVLEEFETSALGAFLIAAQGVGIYGSIEEAASVPRVREVVIPDPARTARYAEWFALYLDLYERLQPAFEARHDLFMKHDLGGTERLENL